MSKNKKAELKRAGFKNSYQNEIDETVAKELGITNRTISNWKRGFGQTEPKKYSRSQQNKLMKHYYEIKGKNSKMRDEDIAKILKIGRRTLHSVEEKLGQTTLKHKHSHSEQKELMNRYYEIKDKTPKLRDEEIAKMLKIGSATLIRWKRQFKRQKFYPNVVDELFVEDRGIYS
uniref:Transposase n=1 Tax=Globodera rostochiensis TaxID=31243 RepID=A0A914H3Z7_GLORO